MSQTSQIPGIFRVDDDASAAGALTYCFSFTGLLRWFDLCSEPAAAVSVGASAPSRAETHGRTCP